MRTTSVLSISLEVPNDGPDDPADRLENNLANVRESLELAESFDPDVVCFPEQMLHRWVPKGEDRLSQAEPVPGPATDAIGERAEALDAYVWLPMTERDGDEYYNAAALVGPDGDTRGSYRKLRPTAGEIDSGLSPGEDVPIWDTEHGRFGAIICFDLMYPEIGVELARRRADVVFFPSHLQGDRRLGHWARDYGFHVVKSHPTTSVVTTPTGNQIARNEGVWNGQEPLEELDAGGVARFAFAEVNTDWGTFTRIPSNRRAVEEIQRRYPGVVYHDASRDETFALESRSDDVTVRELESEFDLVTYRDYLDRTGAACLDASEGARIGAEDYGRTGE